MSPSRGCFRTVFCKHPRRAHYVPFYRERVKIKDLPHPVFDLA